MKRVNVVVEGATEERFVSDVLAKVLWPHQVYLIPSRLGVPGHKGGRTNYARLKKDVLLHLKSDPTAYCSTMLDFYGLGDGFPGTPIPSDLPNIAKVERIEQSVKTDICELIPDFRPDIRFFPYIQLHEFEGLLFGNPHAFATAMSQPHLSREFQRVREGFPTPEDIDDGPDTAPSKRVLQACRSYRKVLHGTIAAGAVGIEAMRRECPHFGSWIEHLEELAR